MCATQGCGDALSAPAGPGAALIPLMPSARAREDAPCAHARAGVASTLGTAANVARGAFCFAPNPCGGAPHQAPQAAHCSPSVRHTLDRLLYCTVCDCQLGGKSCSSTLPRPSRLADVPA